MRKYRSVIVWKRKAWSADLMCCWGDKCENRVAGVAGVDTVTGDGDQVTGAATGDPSLQ